MTVFEAAGPVGWPGGRLDDDGPTPKSRRRKGRPSRHARPEGRGADPVPGHPLDGTHGPPVDAAVQDPEPDADEVARRIVLRQLTMAPRSRAQLEEKLRQRGCADDVAGRVLDRMTEVGLVDDAAYAQMLVRSQQSGRGLARSALARELRTKGIDDELVSETLADVNDEQEREQARALVTKRLRSMAGLDAQVQARRLAGMLARKGYSAGMSWSVIRDALAEAPEHRRD